MSARMHLRRYGSPPSGQPFGRIARPWERPWQEILQELSVSKEAGLSEPEALRRLRQHGRNRLQAVARKSATRREAPSGAEARLLRELLEIGALCNNGQLASEDDPSARALGDPTELALLAAAAEAGMRRGELIEEYPELREEAFDSETKRMATIHRHGEGFRVAVKSAPESVIGLCTELLATDGPRELTPQRQEHWVRIADRLGAKGLRVLALASKQSASPKAPAYQQLALAGLVGLHDPPRQDVPAAIETCREVGIRVVMITGDQPHTAVSIARAVGLADENDAGEPVHDRDIRPLGELDPEGRQRLLSRSVYARVSPRQKPDLIALHQAAGAVVAMTGDGVNDTPALKKADIGVAMGLRGTQVAHEAADMVLKDDALGTIVSAVHEGRIMFGDIRKFCLYLLSCNLSEMFAVSLASLAGAPLPLLPPADPLPQPGDRRLPRARPRGR